MQIKKLTVGYVQTNCYIVSNEETKEAVIVDPGDRGDQIIECCKREDVYKRQDLYAAGAGRVLRFCLQQAGKICFPEERGGKRYL